MNTLTMLRRSFNQLRNNPLRTMLTLLGVVFGVGAVVAMMSIGEGAQRQILAQIEAMGATSVHIRARDVPDTELTALINDSVGMSTRSRGRSPRSKRSPTARATSSASQIWRSPRTRSRFWV